MQMANFRMAFAAKPVLHSTRTAKRSSCTSFSIWSYTWQGGRFSTHLPTFRSCVQHDNSMLCWISTGFASACASAKKGAMPDKTDVLQDAGPWCEDAGVDGDQHGYGIAHCCSRCPTASATDPGTLYPALCGSSSALDLLEMGPPKTIARALLFGPGRRKQLQREPTTGTAWRGWARAGCAPPRVLP